MLIQRIALPAFVGKGSFIAISGIEAAIIAPTNIPKD